VERVQGPPTQQRGLPSKFLVKAQSNKMSYQILSKLSKQPARRAVN
jgi:hypothetical protein